MSEGKSAGVAFLDDGNAHLEKIISTCTDIEISVELSGKEHSLYMRPFAALSIEDASAVTECIRKDTIESYVDVILRLAKDANGAKMFGLTGGYKKRMMNLPHDVITKIVAEWLEQSNKAAEILKEKKL